MEFVEPIRDTKQLKAMQEYLKANYKEKYYVMFMLGIYSGLRISDIVNLRVIDVYTNNKTVEVVKIRAKKTNKIHIFPITNELKPIIKAYCENKNSYDFLIPGKRTDKGIDRTQAWKILNKASEYIGVSHIGTHSMRKTFGYHYYKQTNDIVTLQQIFGHTHPSVTLRYIGVNNDTIVDSMKRFKYDY